MRVIDRDAGGEGEFVGGGGLRLFRRFWRPEGEARGVLALVHGLGDHSNLYPILADHLVARGWIVHAVDLRGHGRSPGQRAYISSWDDFRDDLDRFLAVVRREEPGQPLFLLGNSLGGLIALDYVLDRPEGLRGVIAVAPPLGSVGVPAHLLLLARLLSRVWPRFSRRTGMDLSGLARDKVVIETVLADPLFHREGTARLATEVERVIARLQREAARFTAPLLILHGGADRMVPADGSRAFFPKAGSRDKEFREYPGAYHALLADTGHEEVLGDLERWMMARLPGRAELRR